VTALASFGMKLLRTLYGLAVKAGEDERDG
jgi:hypothetical protein